MPLFTPSRTKWRKWYTSIEIVHADSTTGQLLATVSANGNGIGSVNSQSVTVLNQGNAFNLVLPHDIGPLVSVISYWTDRNLTNTGATGNIAVWTNPQLIRLTTNSATKTIADGTQVQTVFTANYGGAGLSRAYVVQQQLDYRTVPGYPDGNDPLNIKSLRFQRRGQDATDTSGDSINLTGVYVYEI